MHASSKNDTRAPAAATNSITHVFLIAAAVETEQRLASQQPSTHTTRTQCFLLDPLYPCEVVRGARTSYFADEESLGEVRHNCSQPLAAFWNQQDTVKSLWSEHIPTTPESGLWAPSLNIFLSYSKIQPSWSSTDLGDMLSLQVQMFLLHAF